MFCLIRFDSLRPINNLSVKQGRIFLGWTNYKLDKCVLLKDHNAVTPVSSNPRPLGLQSSTLPLSHCAPPHHVMADLGIHQDFWEPLLKYENAESNGEQEKEYLCEEGIEKSSPSDHCLSSLGKLNEAKR